MTPAGPPEGLSVRQALAALGKAAGNAVTGRLRFWREESEHRRLLSRSTRAPLRPRCIALVGGSDRPIPPVAYGGVEVLLHVMAVDLRSRGWEVHLWGAFQRDRPALYEGLELHEGTDPAGLEIERLNPAVAYLAWPTAVQLRRLAADPRRVVIGEFNHPDCLPPVVEGTYVRCWNPLFAREAAKNGWPSDRVLLLPPWQRDETRHQPEIPREDWLLWVGRPDPNKALEEAFRFSQLTGERVRFATPWFPGDLPWAQMLARVQPPTVEYLGEISRAEKPALYSRCRALLYTAKPSYKEAYGLIFLEALTSGTPVVALDHHPGSTQSELFPGPPVGLRAPDTDRLVELWKRHASELDPEAVFERCRQVYDPVALADRFVSSLGTLCEKHASSSSLHRHT